MYLDLESDAGFGSRFLCSFWYSNREKFHEKVVNFDNFAKIISFYHDSLYFCQG